MRYGYDLAFLPLTLKSFSTTPTRMMNICAEFY